MYKKFLLLITWLQIVIGFQQTVFNLNNGNFEYIICDETSNTFKLTEFRMEPDVPTKGVDIKLILNGILNENILDGSEIYLNVRYRTIKLLTKKMNLCRELENAKNIDIKCPITRGDKKLEYKFTIPEEVPSGEYMIDLLLKNVDKTNIFCSNIKLKL